MAGHCALDMRSDATGCSKWLLEFAGDVMGNIGGEGGDER